MRSQNSYQNQASTNPITNTALPYQQQARTSPYYQQQYPQAQSTQGQFAQQPSQSNGFSNNNTYYNQTLPQSITNIEQQKPPTTQSIQVPQQESVDVIELDHLNGFSGRYADMIHFHPQQPNMMIYAIAGLVVVENVNDKHQQTFLRGHDMDVSALAVSRSGRYIASGQLGTKFAKMTEAPVILWDYLSKKPLQVFRGLRDGVTNISFSDDEKFMCATSSSNAMTIWNCLDFTVVHNKLLEVPIVTWCPPRKSSSKHSSYMLITSQGTNILINLLDFDVSTMQYILKQAPCQLPSTGLVRQYTKAVIDQQGEYLYVGTHAGEVCIFSISSNGGLFKAAIPISNNGVQNLRISGSSLFVSSGDGKFKKLNGSDTRWGLQSEVQLEGRLNSIAIDPSGREILVGSNFGKIYRLIAQNLDCSVHSDGHLQAIIGLTLPRDSCDIFVTIDMEGYILVWDLNDVLVITRCAPSTMNRVRGSAICLDDDKTIVSGWKDGFLRAYQITNKPISPLKWELVNAHKGAITSIYADKNYYLSGGEDGIVRIWSKSARQLITQISVHTKDVTKVFPDISRPNIIHSCSLDKTINSYDLKIDKKVMLHSVKNGLIMDMTQLKDREQELVTCGLNTPILFWDVDVVEPIDNIEPGLKLNTIQISPDGKFLASGSDQGDLVLLSLVTNSVMGKYLGHSQGVSKVSWTCDQKQVITTSYDGSICVWNVYL